MGVDSMASITAPGGPKQILDTYIGTQDAGSFVAYKYRENVRGIDHLLIAMLIIMVSSRGAAVTKMNQVDNNLDLLPNVLNLVFAYTEVGRDDTPE